ncbi:MAG: hypothetical protein QOJ85_2632 [Solirubrobacteraceae bacterium]|nr:hypothetical protein [Solirubrobacteraceae bacterium]
MRGSYGTTNAQIAYTLKTPAAPPLATAPNHPG